MEERTCHQRGRYTAYKLSLRIINGISITLEVIIPIINNFIYMSHKEELVTETLN